MVGERLPKASVRGPYTCAALVALLGALGYALIPAPSPALGSVPEPVFHTIPKPDPEGERTTRIVGGSPADRGWTVALAAGDRSIYRDQTCGGALVSSNSVLTAAHCVVNDNGYIRKAIQDHGLRVLVGRASLSGYSGEIRYAAEIGYWSGLYKPKKAVWDVAILTLDSPASTGTPVQIAGPDEASLWVQGRPVWTSGWGLLGDGSSPDWMRNTWLTVMSKKTCQAAWGIPLYTDTQLCAGSPPRGGRATCSGDSGGPLVSGSSSGAPRLVGLTSFGLGRCGVLPDGFTKVAANPIRSAVQSAVLEETGINIVGAGQTEAPLIDGWDARANAGIYAGYSCDKIRFCVKAVVKGCRQASQRAWNCRVHMHLRSGFRFTAKRNVVVRDYDNFIERVPVGRWRLALGWR